MALSKCLLLVDFNNVIYRACGVNQNLSYQGEFTGGLYGFYSIICGAINKYGVTSIAICQDTPPYFREDDFPNYKGDRVREAKEGQVSIADLKRVAETQILRSLSILKWPAFSFKGFEADDVIAHLSSRHYDDFEKILIMSNDDDLAQVLDDDLKIAQIRKNGLYTRKDLYNDFGEISNEKLITLYSLTGTHNNVPGIKGIGPKTALKMIKNGRLLEEAIEKNLELVERNRKLIKLPYRQLPDECEIQQIQFGNPQRSFMRFLSEYGISMTPSMSDALEQLEFHS